MKYSSHPIIDNGIALRLLAILCTPFKEFPAYKAGIIDDKGKYIVPKDKRTKLQKKSLTYLDKLMINVKKIINKLPGGENKLKNIVTAMFLIKESFEHPERNPDLLEEYERPVTKDEDFSNMVVQAWVDYLEHGAKEITLEDVCTTGGIAIAERPLSDDGVYTRLRKDQVQRWLDVWNFGSGIWENSDK